MGPSQEQRANEEEMRQMNLAVSEGAIEVLYERLDIKQVNKKYRKRVSTVVNNVKADDRFKKESSHLLTRVIERLVYEKFNHNTVVKIAVPDKLYTEHERKAGLLKFIEGEKSSFILHHYGVPERTLHRDRNSLFEVWTPPDLAGGSSLKDIRAWLATAMRDGASDDDKAEVKKLRAVIEDMEFRTSGPPPEIDQQDRDILAIKSISLPQGEGRAVGTKAMQVIAQRFVEARKSAEGGEGAVSSNSSKTAYGRGWQRRNLRARDATFVGNADVQLKLMKASVISRRRAIAADPIRGEVMFTLFDEEDKRLIREGVLPPGGWKAHQVYNYDETPGDTTGSAKYFPVYCFVDNSDRNAAERKAVRTRGNTQSSFLLVDNEKQSYHQSIGLFENADGSSVILPVICQQCGEKDYGDGVLRGDFFLNLHPDMKVWASPSSYFDYGAFELVIDQFIEFSGCGPDEPRLLYIDGHKSHTYTPALDKALKNNVNVRFLRSNNSSYDQMLDMGTNAKFKALRARQHEKWKLDNPNVPCTVAVNNLILAKAIEELMNDANRPISSAAAFKKSRAFPLSNPLREDASPLEPWEKENVISTGNISKAGRTDTEEDALKDFITRRCGTGKDFVDRPSETSRSRRPSSRPSSVGSTDSEGSSISPQDNAIVRGNDETALEVAAAQKALDTLRSLSPGALALVPGAREALFAYNASQSKDWVTREDGTPFRMADLADGSKVAVIKQHDVQYSLAVNSFSRAAHYTTYVTPASEILDATKEEKRLKRVRVPREGSQSAVWDTSMGAVYNNKKKAEVHATAAAQEEEAKKKE